MSKITITELSRGLSDFINRATYRQEEFLIMRGGKPVATLSPVPAGVRGQDLERTLAGMPSLAPEDLSAFEDDLEEARKAGNEPLTDPWPSS